MSVVIQQHLTSSILVEDSVGVVYGGCPGHYTTNQRRNNTTHFSLGTKRHTTFIRMIQDEGRWLPNY